jgi:hypothetical protein
MSVADRTPQSQRRLTTHRSISTSATAHVAMSAGTAAASASAPPSSATPIAKRNMPKRPAPQIEAGVGNSSIARPADRASRCNEEHPQEFVSAMAGRVKSFTQSGCRVNSKHRRAKDGLPPLIERPVIRVVSRVCEVAHDTSSIGRVERVPSSDARPSLLSVPTEIA